MSRFMEDDVELAERYVAALREIEELTDRQKWTEEDVELAERHVAALEQLETLEA